MDLNIITLVLIRLIRFYFHFIPPPNQPRAVYQFDYYPTFYYYHYCSPCNYTEPPIATPRTKFEFAINWRPFVPLPIYLPTTTPKTTITNPRLAWTPLWIMMMMTAVWMRASSPGTETSRGWVEAKKQRKNKSLTGEDLDFLVYLLSCASFSLYLFGSSGNLTLENIL